LVAAWTVRQTKRPGERAHDPRVVGLALGVVTVRQPRPGVLPIDGEHSEREVDRPELLAPVGAADLPAQHRVQPRERQHHQEVAQRRIRRSTEDAQPPTNRRAELCGQPLHLLEVSAPPPPTR